ncbi:hypothetical protein BSL78_14464 [Apostichopus japonicus]|uniref:Uncharacterized protein n=1 Tax=Stichopus japonicus TaxID=307972 RepID=A0A2G8KKW7_STIJA|nr:hypothetical protein BSL78_14464 [Apostichopus japonicus]
MEAVLSSRKTKTLSSDLIVDNFPVMRKNKRLVIKLKRCRLWVGSTTLLRGQKSQQEALVGKPTDHSSHIELPSLQKYDSHVLNGINEQTRTDEMSDTDNDELRVQEGFSNNRKRARLDDIVYRLQRRILAESSGKVTSKITISDSTVLPLHDQNPSTDGDDNNNRPNCTSANTFYTTHCPGLQVVSLMSKTGEDLKLDRIGMNRENMAETQHDAMVTPTSSKSRETSSHVSSHAELNSTANNQMSASFTSLSFPPSDCQLCNHGKFVKEQAKSEATFPRRLENGLRRCHQIIHPCIKYVYFPNNPCAHSPNIVWPPCIDMTRTNEVNQLQSYWTFSATHQPSHSVHCMVSALPIPTANTSIVLPWIQQQQRSIPNVALPWNISQTRTLIRSDKLLHTS